MTTKLTTRKGNKMEITGNEISGDTYPVKDYLKSYCDARWNKERKTWTVDVEKLNDLLDGGNSIGLRIDDSDTVTRKATGTADTNGWCNHCHSYCWGDCQS